jgi:membrane fusion protein (multidrug efflux system)
MFSMKKPKKEKVFLWGALALFLLIVIYLYWLHARRYPSTDNAYIGANIVQVSPQVSGPIVALYVKEYQMVKKDQPLFDIDPEPFQVAVDKASAQLDLTKQRVESLRGSIAVAEALLLQRQSEMKLAEGNYKRIMVLVKRGLASPSDGDKVTSTLEVAKAAVTQANNQLLKAKAELGDSDVRNADIRAAEAQLAEAKLNLKDTHVVSSVDGYVINLTARVGSMAQAERSLFAVIDATQWWADANFKETQMQRIQPGQPATVVVDIYPDHVFHGVVQNISRGSGSAFSIFPAENATGNWVKVTQRFTVRVRISDPDPQFPLRVGASSTVTVDTKGSH